MSTEVEHASGNIQTTTATQSPTTSKSGPKTSMFAKKTGFVIPKNKLGGSLVPAFRGTKRGDADLVKEESSNQVQRKTKWGPDLTLDPTTRKGRALAYQARINQISQQLTLGTVTIEEHQDTLSTSDHQLSNEEKELLELERREIIGEIIKLNPTYKAPADYKPLLKEAKVPIPIKEYPGYNFIGLVFGPANDTQKRLEKETGAKIRVYGTKADTGAKVEVAPTDRKEVDSAAYEDLYVHVSADTFEKIDAAVALIELLVTPVSVNPVSSSTPATISDDNANANINQSTPSSIAPPAPMNQGTAQPYPGSLPLLGQFPQYPQPWLYPQSVLVTPANSSVPLLSSSVQVSSSPFNPLNTSSLFSPRPIIAPSFSPVPQNPPVVTSRPLQPPYMEQAPPSQTGPGPRNTPVPILPPSNARPVISTAPNNMISPLSAPFHSGVAIASQQSAFTIQPAQLAMPQVPMQAPSSNFIPRPAPIRPQPGNPNSFSSFDPRAPNSGAISRPQRPSSSDFTFQPHRPPNAGSWQTSQPPHQNITPQSPFSRPPMQNLNPPPIQGSPRPPQQINQPRGQIPPSFVGNPMVPPVPLRHPVPQVQPRNFIPTHMINNPSGPFPPRPGNQMHIQQNHPHGATHPQRFPPPQQHFGNRPGMGFSSSSGGQQVYDPFSPTSASFNHQMGGNMAKFPGENDPEYEDLMASVGLK